MQQRPPPRASRPNRLEKSVRTPPPATAPCWRYATSSRAGLAESAVMKSAPRSPAANGRWRSPGRRFLPKKSRSGSALARSPLQSRANAPRQKRLQRVRQPPAPLTRSTARSAALPPIELVSNADTARRHGSLRATAAGVGQPRHATFAEHRSPRVKPAIELVSRPTSPPATTVARPVPALSSAAAVRSQNAVSAGRKEYGRPVTGIRRDAENFGNWVGRTSASVGTEIQRGLDSANRAVGGWTGPCIKSQRLRSSSNRSNVATAGPLVGRFPVKTLLLARAPFNGRVRSTLLDGASALPLQ